MFLILTQSKIPRIFIIFDIFLILYDELEPKTITKPITLPNDSEPEPDLAIVQRLARDYREHHQASN